MKNLINNLERDYNERLKITKDIVKYIRYLDKTYMWFYVNSLTGEKFTFNTENFTIEDVNRVTIEFLETIKVYAKIFQKIEDTIDQIDINYNTVIQMFIKYDLKFNDFFNNWENLRGDCDSYLNAITISCNTTNRTPEDTLSHVQDICDTLKQVISIIHVGSIEFDRQYADIRDVKNNFRFHVGFNQYIVKHGYIKIVEDGKAKQLLSKKDFLKLKTDEINCLLKCTDLIIKIDKQLNHFDKINAISTTKYYQERLKDFMSYTSLYQLYLDVQKSNLD